MTPIQVIHFYPKSTYFNKNDRGESISCECSSFLGKKGNEEADLYRLVVRVSDGAYQIFKAIQANPESLFLDAQCRNVTDITIMREWTFPISPK